MNVKGCPPPPINSPAGNKEWVFWFEKVFKGYPHVQTFSQSIAPANVGANSTSEQTFTVAGLQIDDIVFLNKPSYQAGLFIGNARVSLINTLAITFVNNTGGGIVPTTETYKMVAVRL